MAERTLRAHLLGEFAVFVDGRQLAHSAFERPSGLRLLKLVLATPGHRVRREDAAERLWPEGDPERSAANLRKAIHFARSALRTIGGDEVLSGSGEQIAITPGIRLDIDADRLLDAVAQVERGPSHGTEVDGAQELAALRTLAELGGEELLPGDPYEEWAVPLRERLRQQARAALLRGAGRARALDERSLAFALVDRALQLDPADEEAHRLAIEMHLEAGESHSARRQLQTARVAIAEAYGVAPSPDLEALVAASVPARSASGTGPAAAPIIGRRREIEAVEAILDRAAGGHLGAVVIRGPAGIGKTRLLLEVERELRSTAWNVLAARGLESSAAIPFSGLAQALAAALDGRIPADWGDPARSAAIALGIADGSPALMFASDEALAAGVVDAIVRLSRSPNPVAIVVDDVQWLDGQSVACIGAALAALHGQRALVVLAMRELEAPPAHVVALLEDVRRADGVEIGVEPLGPREIQLIVEREAGDSARLDPALTTWLVDRAAGIPLFAVELFRGLRAAGACDLRDGRWVLGRRPPDLLPRTVALLVDARMARLDEQVRDILATAAEVRDEVGFDALQLATGADAGAVLDALDAGIGAGLLVEADGRYRFAHPLFRAGLRKGVPARRRPAMHLRIATALAAGIDPRDRSAIDAAAASVDLLAVAEHAAAAVELGAPEALGLAIGFGFAAGSRQADLFDAAGAGATLRRSIAFWHRLPDADRADFPAARALVALGWALLASGDRAAAADAFQAATSAARTDAERATAWSAAAWLPYQQGRFGTADEVLSRGLTTVADPIARASLLADRGWIIGRLGRWREARRHLEEAVPALEHGAPPLALARALDRLGVTIRDTGEPMRALPVFERARALAAGIHATGMEAAVNEHLAGALRLLGRLDEARAAVTYAIGVARMSGDRYMESVSEWIASEVDHTAGDLRSAQQRRRRELEILASIGGNAQNEAMAHAHLFHLARLLGDVSGAAVEADAARAVARHSGIERLSRRVEAALAAEDWFDAGAHTEAGVEDEPPATAEAEPPATAEP